jgi:hypothetical protein
MLTDYLLEQSGIGNSSTPDGNLVRSSGKQRCDIGQRGDAPTNSQRDKYLLCTLGHHIQHGLAVFTGGVDIKECDLVCTFLVVARSEFYRVTDVSQSLKIDAFHDSASGNIKAWNYSDSRH